MKKCKNCKCEMEIKFFNQKYCQKDECFKIFYKELNEKKNKIRTKETKEKLIELMTNEKYASTYVQPLVNKLARIIDNNFPCICTNLNVGKMNGGHFFSVGSNRGLRFNLHNIHKQSFQSNHFKSGDNVLYRAGLINRYGLEYINFIDSLQMLPQPKFKRFELELIKERATILIKDLENKTNTLTKIDIVNYRTYCNQFIMTGIIVDKNYF